MTSGPLRDVWTFGLPKPDVYYDPRTATPGPPWASLHAKCVIVDDENAFITSANFTDRGQSRNIEVGGTHRGRAFRRAARGALAPARGGPTRAPVRRLEVGPGALLGERVISTQNRSTQSHCILETMGMRSRALLLVWLGVMGTFGAGCRKKGPACSERVEALDAWMQQLAAEGDAVPKGSVVSVDERSNVGVDGTDIELDGARVVFEQHTASTADPSSMQEELRKQRGARIDVAKRLLLKDAEELAARLRIRPSTTWHDVVTTFDALGRVGYTRVAIVLIGKSSVTAPTSTDVSQWFEEHPSKSDDWSMPAAPARALLQCPKLLTPLRATSDTSIDRNTKSKTLHEDVPMEMKACGCQVDDEAVKAIIWSSYGRYSGVPSLTHTLVPGTRGAAGVVEVTAAASVSWESMATRVLQAASKNMPVALVSN